jgi:hypothetical protein
MFRGSLSLGLAVLAPVLALAGPTEEFIAARAKHKVFELSTPQDLKDLKEGGYLELQAKVFGSIKSENGAVSIIARFGDFSQTVTAAKAPDWLLMGVSEVRMLLKATMVDTQLVPALELVASVPEIDMARIDESMRPRWSGAKPRRRGSRWSSTASRAAGSGTSAAPLPRVRRSVAQSAAAVAARAR